MKCYVTLNSDDNCVITRLDRKYPELHQKTMSRGEFTNYWYKKIHLEMLIRWFQFMSDDSFCAEWTDLTDSGIKTRECIFILDESIITSGIKDYLKKEIADYFDEHRAALQTRCDDFEKYLSLIEKEEYRLIDAIREFDKTGSLKYIENIVPLKDVPTIINLYGKNWCKTKVLFSDQNIANKTNNRLRLVSFGCLLLIAYAALFSPTNLLKTFFSFIGPLMYSNYTRKNHAKTANEMVLQRLRKSLADEQKVELDSDTKTEEPRKEKDEHFLIRYAKEISAYMESLPEMDFSNERKEISTIVQEFPIVAADHDFTVKARYIIKLIELAERIYSKEIRLGLSNRVSEFSNIENLRNYLEFIGFKRENIESNPVYKMLSDTLPIIEETPFYGCESSVLRLYKTCIKSLIDRSFQNESYGDIEAETEITAILENLERAKEYSRLQNAKNAIQELSSISYDQEDDPTDLGTEPAKRIAFAKKDESTTPQS